MMMMLVVVLLDRPSVRVLDEVGRLELDSRQAGRARGRGRDA